MPDAILSSRRVDPEKVDDLRAHFEDLADRRAVFERGLDLENVRTEAAFLDEDDDGPVLYYYMERGTDYPPDIDRDDVDDEAVLALSRDHRAALEDACVEDARDEDGTLRRFETLFFATTADED